MSRWKSPQTAARRAERAANEAEQRRIEKRRSLLLVVGIIAVSLGLTVADFFWLRARAESRRKHPHQQHGQSTNNPSMKTNR